MNRFITLCVVVVLIAGSVAPSHAAMPQWERVYYHDFFKATAKTCVLDSWQDVYDAVYRTSFNTYPLASAQALYAAIRNDLAVIETRWDGATLSLVSSPPLQLAVGVERNILVEVFNDVSVSNTFTAYFNSLPTISNTANAPRSTTRGLMTPCKISAGASSMDLRVVVSGVTHNLTIPISLVRAATINGAFFNADTSQPWPARAYVKCVDNEYRQAKSFEGIANDINTIRQKVILGATGSPMYKLPFSYSELDGTWTMDVPPGETVVTLERGYEFENASVTVLGLLPGETRAVTLSAGRFINMRAADWISGETHVHWSVNAWHTDENYDILDAVRKAEDIQVVNNLTLRHVNPVHGEFIAPDDYPPGPIAAYCDNEWHIQQAEEYRNSPFYGHVNMLNITEIVEPISTGNEMGPGAVDYPINSTQIELALAQTPPDGTKPIVTAAHGVAGSIAADIIRHRIESIDQPNLTQYYSLLDAGLRIPLTTGADHPARLVGQSRCYVKIDGPFSYGAWINGIRARRTFITSGPLLFLTINGKEIGDEICVDAGEVLQIQATAVSRDPIGALQIYSNNQVLQQTSTSSNVATIDFNFVADQSRWIVARSSSGPGFQPLTQYGVAHTSPIYVKVDGARIYDQAKANQWRQALINGGNFVYNQGDFDQASHRDEAQAMFDDGAEGFNDLQYYADFRASITKGPAPLTVTFTDHSTGSPTSWEWDFNDDGVVDWTGPTPPPYTYAASGEYTVRLRVQNAAGAVEEVKQGYIRVQ